MWASIVPLEEAARIDAEAGCEDREQDKESDDDERFHGPIIGRFSS
jgi:hypothetical protein